MRLDAVRPFLFRLTVVPNCLNGWERLNDNSGSLRLYFSSLGPPLLLLLMDLFSIADEKTVLNQRLQSNTFFSSDSGRAAVRRKLM